MGKRKCCIEGCSSTSNRKEDEGVTFHKFAAKLTDEWLKACRVDAEKKNSVAFVCSRHFRKSDFQDFKGNKYFLKQGAVPSIFPWTYKSKASSGSTTTPSATTSKTQGSEGESSTKIEVDPVISGDPNIASPVSIQLDSKLLEPEINLEIKELAGSPEIKQKSTEVPSLVGPKVINVTITPKTPVKKRRRTLKKELESASPEPARKLSRRTLNKSLKQEESEEPQNQTKLDKPVKVEKSVKPEATKNIAPASTSTAAPVTPKKKSPAINFLPGSLLEAQDFDGKWIQVRIIEVDTGEGDILVRSEKNAKNKGAG